MMNELIRTVPLRTPSHDSQEAEQEAVSADCSRDRPHEDFVYAAS